MTMVAPWEVKAAAKRAKLAASIPKEYMIPEHELPPADRLDVSQVPKEFLSKEVIEITELTATEIVDAIAKGKYSAVEVTTAFIKRAVLAHQLLNVFTEFFPEIALKRAAELDEYYKSTGKTIGPIHGLPISLKDQFRVKGVETCMGYVSWITNEPEKENSTIVDLLLNAGAVFFVKTNIPTSLMAAESRNCVFGQTVNAYNRTLAPGGSSGGEGAIVSMRGATIGIGTDIGGSIRIPSSFSGVYGLRPSHERFPYLKVANSLEFSEAIVSVDGPLAVSLPDLTLFSKALLAQEPWKHDPRVLALPFKDYEIPPRPLVFAIESNDGLVTPHPPVLRAIKIVTEALKDAGHEVFEFKPYKPEEGWNVVMRAFTVDGGENIQGDLDRSGEPGIPDIQMFIKGYKALTMSELFTFNKDKLEYKTAFLEYMNCVRSPSGKKIDAWIRPTTVSASVPAGQLKIRYLGYTALLNLLDYTSVVIPVTKADPAIDVATPAPGNGLFKAIEQKLWEDYVPEDFTNGPVGIQVIGGRLEEERMLAVAGVVDAALKS
ncbi:amidase signature domain-containing protein [Lipomyces doorenjongii]|uniref:amidase signature domain-containing protein n=1 Tax=Lipomyces doorenjongii TaxID=383834 RepID=UPI0034CE683F